jgi:hypothetical protein
MFPCTNTIGLPSARASPALRTSGREATTQGTSRPSVLRASEPRWNVAPRSESESRKVMTSPWVDVSA